MTLTIPQVELYPHNRETYNKICDMWKNTDKVAAIQATGTGKTYLQLQCLYDFNDAPKVVLAPSNHILDQLLAKSEGNLQNTQLLTYAKLSQMSLTEIEALKPSLIVLDEFHRCGADEWGKGVENLFTVFPSAKVLGTSATPIRYLDGARNMADELFENNLAVNSNLTDAWARGILPYPKYVTALYTLEDEAQSLQDKINNSSNDEESKMELTKRLDDLKRNLDMSVGVPQILRKHISSVGRKYIVFCKDKVHLKEMEPLVIDWFLQSGIANRVDSYRVSHGEASNSEELMRFRENTNSINVRLLFSIEMLNEGIHVDDITGVILLRPTVSPIIHFQQMGRAFSAGRTNEPLIFDLVNNVASIHSDDLRKEFKTSVGKEIVRRKASGIKDLHIPEFTIIDETRNALKLFSALESELLDGFDASFEALKAYLEEHDGEYPKQGSRLGRWVFYVRQTAKGNALGHLTQDRIDKLNSILFVWNPYDEHWEMDFIKYAEIVRISGHPASGLGMGRWASNQKTSYFKGNLSQYKIDKLNSIDFAWDSLEERWQKGFNALLKYKDKFGDCLVPYKYEIEGFKLGKWVSSKRVNFKHGALSQDHIDKLNSVGFTWSVLDDLWMDSYNALLKYKEEFGDCAVPKTYGVDCYALAVWVHNQRKLFKKSKLSQDRIDALNAIGFVWDVKSNGQI